MALLCRLSVGFDTKLRAMEHGLACCGGLHTAATAAHRSAQHRCVAGAGISCDVAWRGGVPAVGQHRAAATQPVQKGSSHRYRQAAVRGSGRSTRSRTEDRRGWGVAWRVTSSVTVNITAATAKRSTPTPVRMWMRGNKSWGVSCRMGPLERPDHRWPRSTTMLDSASNGGSDETSCCRSRRHAFHAQHSAVSWV